MLKIKIYLNQNIHMITCFSSFKQNQNSQRTSNKQGIYDRHNISSPLLNLNDLIGEIIIQSTVKLINTNNYQLFFDILYYVNNRRC